MAAMISLAMGACLLTTNMAQGDMMTDLELYSPMDNIDVGTGVVPDDQNNNDGALVGAATKVNDAIRGDVLSLTAMGDRVMYDDVVQPGSDSYTVAFWFKLTDTGSAQMLATQGCNNSSTDRGWAALYSGETIYFRASYSSDKNNRLQIKHAFTDFDEWHHLAVQIDQTNGVIKGYLDGKGSGLLCDQNGWSISKLLSFTPGESFNSATADTYDDLALGLNKTSQSNVRIDDFAIWSRALGDAEIQSMVPEPSSLALVILGLFSLATARRRSSH
jgi:hypothetical protein